MKILTVVPDLGLGGTQRVAQNYAIGIQKQGLDSAVLAYSAGGVREGYLRNENIATFVPNQKNGVHSNIKAAKAWGADIVHIHRTGYENDFETRLMTELKCDGTKVVETNVFGRFDWSRGGALIDVHCQLTRWCSYKWHSWGGKAAKLKKFAIVPNAVDPSAIEEVDLGRRQQLKAELGVPSGAFLFGRIGQPFESKWSMEIFQPFEKLIASGENVALLLVGAPTSHTEYVKKLPKEVSGRIKVLEVTQSDAVLSEYFSVLDCFLHVSQIGESFGMVLCEAMMAGVPIITLSTPMKDNSQLEVVQHGAGGIVVLNKLALAKAMREMMEKREHSVWVRERGRASTISRFGVDSVMRKLIPVYENSMSVTSKNSSQAFDEYDDAQEEAWMRQILQRGIGQTSPIVINAGMPILHNQHVYKTWLKIRGIKARLSRSN